MSKKLISLILVFFMNISLSSCAVFDDVRLRWQISRMSLKDKICQMIIPAFRYSKYISDTDREMLKEMSPELQSLLEDFPFGGVILFAPNIDNSVQTYELISSIKDVNREAGHIPLLVAVDQEGGSITRLSYGTTMIGNMALGSLSSAEAIQENNTIIANELKTLGFNTDFAPVADVNSNPHNPVINIRSFSDDPDLVAEDVVTSFKSFQENGIISCLKHFPGHGDTASDSHTSLPVVNKTYDDIKEFELKPFKEAIAEGCDMIMTAHICCPQIDDEQYRTNDQQLNYLPSTMSKVVIQDILRGDLGFDGVVITDALDMDAISVYFSNHYAALRAINAGADMLLMPVVDRKPLHMYYRELKEFVYTIQREVENGEISERRIDEAVLRILRLKNKYGLSDENPELEPSAIRSVIGSKENHAKELELAQKAITIVRNDEVLPLKDEKTLVFVPYRSEVKSVEYARQLLKKDDITVYCTDEDDVKTFKKNIEPLLEENEAIVIVSAMYDESDINDRISAVYDQILAFCKEKEDKKTIMISAQLPYDLERYDTDAKLAAYYAFGMKQIITDYSIDNPEYGANLIAAVMDLFESDKAQGKLPVNVPDIVKDGSGHFSLGDQIAYPRAASRP